MKKSIIIFLMLISLKPQIAHAQTNVMTAINLLQACTRPDMDWIDFCNGFFQAVNDYANINGIACTPPGVTRTHIVSLFHQEGLRVLEASPQLAEKPGLTVAATILGNKYPCQ
jgi:hypothetical protein